MTEGIPITPTAPLFRRMRIQSVRRMAFKQRRDMAGRGPGAQWTGLG